MKNDNYNKIYRWYEIIFSFQSQRPPQIVQEVAQEEMPPYVVTVTVRVTPLEDNQSKDLDLGGVKTMGKSDSISTSNNRVIAAPFRHEADPAASNTLREIESAVDEFGHRPVIAMKCIV